MGLTLLCTIRGKTGLRIILDVRKSEVAVEQYGELFRAFNDDRNSPQEHAVIGLPPLLYSTLYR